MERIQQGPWPKADIFCIDACGHLALTLRAFKYARDILHFLDSPQSPIPEFRLHADIRLFDTVHGYREKSNMGEPRLSIPSDKLTRLEQEEYIRTLSSYAQFVTKNPDLIEIVETDTCRDFWGTLVKISIPERVLPVLMQDEALQAALKRETFKLISVVNPCTAEKIGAPENVELIDPKTGLMQNRYVVQSLRRTAYGERGGRLWDLMREEPNLGSARKDAGEKAFLSAVTHLLSDPEQEIGRVIFVTKDSLACDMIERFLNGRHAISGDRVRPEEYAHYHYRMRPQYAETYVMGELSFYIFLEDLYEKFERMLEHVLPDLPQDHPLGHAMHKMDRTLHVLFNQVIVGNDALRYGSECVYSTNPERQYESYNLHEIFSLQPVAAPVPTPQSLHRQWLPDNHHLDLSARAPAYDL